MHVACSIANICFREDSRSHLSDNYDEVGGYPVRRKRNQSVKGLLSNIVVLYDPAINKAANEMNNQTKNIYNKITTVHEYVTKTIRTEASMVKSMATLLRFLISLTGEPY